MKKISNPLTIIGMFASIAQVAGTVVLPLVSIDLQMILIRYVIGFPVLLVILFFFVLIYKREALYAPSDFADEKDFLKLFNKQKFKKAIDKLDETKQNNPDKVNQIEKMQYGLCRYYAFFPDDKTYKITEAFY